MNALRFVLDSPKATAIIRDVGDSNIVLKFFGWVDQNETDFHKGRSLAINAAAQALTASGFALPEPIYRLRFDEGAALPFKSMDAAPSRSVERPSPTPVLPPAVEDTSPDTHIERMVADERAVTGKEDLLDSKRPIE